MGLRGGVFCHPTREACDDRLALPTTRATTPPTTPPTTAPTTPSEAPTTPPTTIGPPPGDELPTTGTRTGLLIGSAAALLGSGGLLIVFARQRRRFEV